MSAWRQKGFVQDSDEEEEESQLESQNQRRNRSDDGRVERVDKISDDGRDGEESESAEGEEASTITDEKEGTFHALDITSAKEEQSRIPSPIRGASMPPSDATTRLENLLDTQRERSESPDPLQSSQNATWRRIEHPQSAQALSSEAFNTHSSSNEARHSAAANSSQTLGEQLPSSYVSLPADARASATKTTIFEKFGIKPLSDISDDETLSDPPSDLESPETPHFPHLPHRKTAVQVVIPSSTALQRHFAEQESRREFRERKPIQLHPYALEGERYRREVQSRGLKPVARLRSPDRRTGQLDTEIQENDFDPNVTPPSSLPEVEIPVSTPEARRSKPSELRQPSATRRTVHSARQKSPHPQLKDAHVAKRRRLNLAITRVATDSTVFSEDVASRHDIWSIPPNSPPYSSSPPVTSVRAISKLARETLQTPTQNLPTPSTSSVLHDPLRPLSESEADEPTRSAQRSGGKLRRPVRIALSEDSTDSPDVHSESEKSDNEVKKVSKKIKGVLPASWLRFDRQAQERRKAQEHEQQRLRMHYTQSPEPLEPQRGVAQRVTKRNGPLRRASSIASVPKEVVVISEESDIEDDDGRALHDSPNTQRFAEDAATITATYDDRYAENDLDDMENDRLHLFTLGGTGSKRKKQTRLTDTLHQAKRLKSSTGKVQKKSHARLSRIGRSDGSRQGRRVSPPALSVIDIDVSPSKQRASEPLFLRLARRQALQRPDLARQSPRRKRIHLQNMDDTHDANLMLHQWRQGSLRPHVNAKPRHCHIQRAPLSDKVDNQQQLEQSLLGIQQNLNSGIASKPKMVRSREGRSERLPNGLRIFQRASTSKRTVSQHKKKQQPTSTMPGRPAKITIPPFRQAQLETNEEDFDHGHRKLAFNQGLRHVDHHPAVTDSNNEPYMNLPLARFLADDNTMAHAPDSAESIEGAQTESLVKPINRRLNRKAPAKRIDIDAREYRQPSEPPVQLVLEKIPVHSTSTEQKLGHDVALLQGLGPHGTHYPITFDVSSLQADTYFHSSTFVGSEDFRRALSIGGLSGRDLDEFAGYCTITHQTTTLRCGPWNDATSSALYDVLTQISKPFIEPILPSEQVACPRQEVFGSLSSFLRLLINYVSEHLSFSDPIDRKTFALKIYQTIFTIFDPIHVALMADDTRNSSAGDWRNGLQVVTYLLVLSVQLTRIGRQSSLEPEFLAELAELKGNMAKQLISNILQRGIAEIGDFLEHNKRHMVRQHGVQDHEILVESIVVCMHVMEQDETIRHGFWDLVCLELGSHISEATHVQAFERRWASLFTLLPFIEIDISGIPTRQRRESFSSDNWQSLSAILRRQFELYQDTYRLHSGSLNEYIRANLARCHRLIKYWHWQRPEQMLNVSLDFFGKMGLRQLRKETNSGSIDFFNERTRDQALTLLPNEPSFHIILKCLGLGLQGMTASYKEKKIRSFVFRSIPNHGRTYPKDQPLDEESLAALRNHHDLLCTLYWAAPPSCRPRLELLRNLVNHETSHREACRVNVRAWANLAIFQIASEEPYESTKPFALWHQDIMHLTLKQYRLAKTEADDYLKSGVLDGTSDVTKAMVKQTMEKNQEQVIATMRDCISGVGKAIQRAKDLSYARAFLIDCDIVHLLELPHLEDRRLTNVIRDTLLLLREFMGLHEKVPEQEESQGTNEESQDYGDFPDLDDFEDVETQPAKNSPSQSSLDFLQTPLWRLLSNAFGAESTPDDNLLMDCVDAWVLFANLQVKFGSRSWSYYLDSYSNVSWQQLRQTDQTSKFSPYFLGALVDLNITTLHEHHHDILTALFVSLADRESMLRFQYRLLHAILRSGESPLLLDNIPFYCDRHTGEWDVNADTLRTRRLALISSMLCNMRNEVQHVLLNEPLRGPEVKRLYASMLKDFMARMRNNYLQLDQTLKSGGAYVDFVQKVVQFLTQYSSDICPVLSFFTNSTDFPLPATDPAYVVGRLCGYAPKANELGIAKQLSVFVQTIAQQAAAAAQQSYLLDQLESALCSEETPATDRIALRSALLQGIFPAYIKEAFSSDVAYLIARPIMRSLQPTFAKMMFDLRVAEPTSCTEIVVSIVAIVHAFIQGSDQLKDNPDTLTRPSILLALANMMEITADILPLLDYVCGRTMGSDKFSQLPLVKYMGEISAYFNELLSGARPLLIPSYAGNAQVTTSSIKTQLLAFSEKGIQDSMKSNWQESHGQILFGHGLGKREVSLDFGAVEEERVKLPVAIKAFQQTLQSLCCSSEMRDVSIADDIVV